MNEIPKITSRDNSRLIRARRIRDGLAGEEMFIEGKRLVVEALNAELKISECFVSTRFAESQMDTAVLSRAAAASRSIFELSDRVFATIADTDRSQGVILVAERPINSPLAIERSIGNESKLPIVVMLSEVNNPANLGAVIRSAEAAGACGLIITERSASCFSAKAIRASMGSVFRMPVWCDVGFTKAIRWAQKFGLKPTAAVVDSPIGHVDIDWTSPRLLVFGSEAHGLETEQLELMSETVSIQMDEAVESLNLAVSAGIILFEARRQSVSIINARD